MGNQAPQPQSQMLWRFQNKDTDVTDIDIFDTIGGDWWGDGITAKDFIDQLRAVETAKIHLHINSPGGYVNDGLAMYNAIKQHEAEVTAFVESEAASAASFVAMAADTIIIAKTAKMFIHDASGWGIGNANDFLALAALLDEESQNIATIYADRAGGTAESWREAMQANSGIGSTYRGQAAVDAGLADEVQADLKKRNVRELRIAAFRNAGRTMSQANLDKLHSAMDSLDAVHEGTCDMDEDCPRMEMTDRSTTQPAVNQEPEPVAPALINIGEALRKNRSLVALRL